MANRLTSPTWIGDNASLTLLFDDQQQGEPPDFLEWIVYSYMAFAVCATFLIARKMNSAIAKFSFFNTFLSLLDIGTDFKMFIALWFYDDHPYWAIFTLLWVLVPFLFHLAKFLYQLFPCNCTCTCPATCTCTCGSGEADWMELVYHIELLTP